MAGKVAVVTDSNSGITQAQAKELGIRVIPTPFFIEDELYLEDITLTRDDFFKKLNEDAMISTSQPAPGDLIDTWDELLKEYDEIVHIPLSDSLSSAYATTVMLSDDYDGKVQVVNNKRVSIMQKSSVLDALRLVEAGKSASEIKAILEEEKLNARAYITVDTLKYLKKGGRVTPTAAALGTVLNIKPVLLVWADKLDSFAKVRGAKAAKKTMLEVVEKDLAENFAGEDVSIYAVTTCDEEETEAWRQEVQKRFPDYEVKSEYLSLSVTCHIGPGALAVAYAKNVK